MMRAHDVDDELAVAVLVEGDVEIAAVLDHVDALTAWVDVEAPSAGSDVLDGNPGSGHAAEPGGIEVVGVLMRPRPSAASPYLANWAVGRSCTWRMGLSMKPFSVSLRIGRRLAVDVVRVRLGFLEEPLVDGIAASRRDQPADDDIPVLEVVARIASGGRSRR